MAREASDERSCSIRAACEARRMASVSAPEAFSANSAARRASAVPKAEASRAYRLRAPTRRSRELSGSARHDRMPWEAARLSNSGQRVLSAVSSMRTTWPSRMACRHGPLSSSYCTASTFAATGSLQATVTGRPLDRMVIPQDRSPPTSRAARTAISCRNCSTLSVSTSASCNSLKSSGRSPPASFTIHTILVHHLATPYPWSGDQTTAHDQARAMRRSDR
jgi:hypothetical protein